MAKGGLCFASCAGEIDVKTDEYKVVDCSIKIAGPEITSVIAQHPAK